jgi:hypothetical protein
MISYLSSVEVVDSINVLMKTTEKDFMKWTKDQIQSAELVMKSTDLG